MEAALLRILSLSLLSFQFSAYCCAAHFPFFLKCAHFVLLNIYHSLFFIFFIFSILLLAAAAAAASSNAAVIVWRGNGTLK